MKTSVVVKKVKHIKILLSEYSALKAIIRFMEKDDKMYSPKAPKDYLSNCKKRLIAIEETFNHLLK